MQTTGLLKWLPLKSSFRRRFLFGFLQTFLSFFFILILPTILPLNQLSVFAQTTSTKVSTTHPYDLTKTVLIGYPNGYPVQFDVRVTNLLQEIPYRTFIAGGLGGFSFKIGYDNTLVTVPDSNSDGIADSGTATAGPWTFLSFPQKEKACSDAYINPDEVTPTKSWLTYTCVTLGSDPTGPVGSGPLARVQLTPLARRGSMQLELAATQLAESSENANLISHTTSTVTVSIMKCADFDGDGIVAVPGDILPLILRYNMTSAHPNWDPKYDLNEDGRIDVVNDILPAIQQYLVMCRQ